MQRLLELLEQYLEATANARCPTDMVIAAGIALEDLRALKSRLEVWAEATNGQPSEPTPEATQK